MVGESQGVFTCLISKLVFSVSRKEVFDHEWKERKHQELAVAVGGGGEKREVNQSTDPIQIPTLQIQI